MLVERLVEKKTRMECFFFFSFGPPSKEEVDFFPSSSSLARSRALLSRSTILFL